MSLTALDPGFHTLIVDRGRRGSRHFGVPVGGAADRSALAIANGLIGNSPDEPALEITLLGPTLQADQSTACVLFGAPFAMALANKGRLLAGTTFTLNPGDAVRIGGTTIGVRAYFAVGGGFQTTPLLGSRSAIEPISAGRTLMCGPSRIGNRSLAFDSLHILGQSPAILRVVPGLHFKHFLEPGQIFETEYEVTPASNRMGLRLAGPPLERRAGELVSEPITPGTVQVTNDGLPLVLGIDGQTIGGYPKIAHVIRADLDRLAQLRPGAKVRFEKVTLAQAATAAESGTAALREWIARLTVTLTRLQ